mmetsp:Transcript_31031/g.75673  ORF Transcript_31031/g.75673 Transcript_31031/m.75673 type:complete len:92 (+) Transcript_31031:140-415(+)
MPYTCSIDAVLMPGLFIKIETKYLQFPRQTNVLNIILQHKLYILPPCGWVRSLCTWAVPIGKNRMATRALDAWDMGLQCVTPAPRQEARCP